MTIDQMEEIEDVINDVVNSNAEEEKIEKEINKNATILVIQDWRLFNSSEINEKFLKKILNDYETYIIENNDYLVIDLDKNQIKNYVKYLIKGMEWSRELGAIYFWNTLLVISLFISLISIWFVSTRPTLDEINKNPVVQKTNTYIAPQVQKTNTWLINK